jgi:hypothetical protein
MARKNNLKATVEHTEEEKNLTLEEKAVWINKLRNRECGINDPISKEELRQEFEVRKTKGVNPGLTRGRTTEEWTEAWMKFAENLVRCGKVVASLKAANIPVLELSIRRRVDADFEAWYQSLMDVCAQMLEDEAFRRAHDGVDEPVFFQGQKCGDIRKYSDTLLTFLLKGMRPEKYKDRVMTESTNLDLAKRLSNARERDIDAE